MLQVHNAGFRRSFQFGATILVAALLPFAAQAQKQYDSGASDKEIKLGNLVPYSGPVSAYAAVGKGMAAYFDKVNASGGINGRKINFISADDAYNPAKSVEQTRKLVEQDEVLAMVGSLGTTQGIAVQRYMNAKKIPQLFVATGASRFGDPKSFPWTMGWQPTYEAEGKVYAQHILSGNPKAKIAVLMQNDDFGKDFYNGFVAALGDKAKAMIVSHQTYEVTDPTIDSQMVSFKSSGADTFFNISTPKFAAQAIRKAADIGWKPVHYIASVSQSMNAVLKPAGLENAVGIITSTYLIDPADPATKDSKDVVEYFAVMKQHYPAGDPYDTLTVIGYSTAATIAYVLKQAGDNLTRENLMKQAANMDFTPPMLYPGINIKTSPTDFYPIEKKTLERFNGKAYEAFGPIFGG